MNFLLPFMGFGFNYTWLSLHGHLSFSNTPIQFPEYPLKFPIQVNALNRIYKQVKKSSFTIKFHISSLFKHFEIISAFTKVLINSFGIQKIILWHKPFKALAA